MGGRTEDRKGGGVGGEEGGERKELILLLPFPADMQGKKQWVHGQVGREGGREGRGEGGAEGTETRGVLPAWDAAVCMIRLPALFEAHAFVVFRTHAPSHPR
jgi:hypothetical protein